MKEENVIAIYIRVSTKEQAEEGYSLDAQKRILQEYCKAKKYNIFNIYSDKGISAKDIYHRPGMLKLLSDAKDQKFKSILVWKLTRFSRNMTDLISTCELLDKLGIALISYSESFDSCTPSGRMVRSMYPAIRTVSQFNRVQRLLIKQGKISGRRRKSKIYILPES
ncbi:MAG: recombinase family protein [Lachnospiraceae bacterium]|nr:recombinase family protein [Lachnospiraceae bacterium]